MHRHQLDQISCLLLQVTVELLLAASTAGTGGSGSVLSFNGFALIALVLGTSITVAWGAYGKNSEYGLSLKRTGPLGAVKVRQSYWSVASIDTIYEPGSHVWCTVGACPYLQCCAASIMSMLCSAFVHMS